MTGRANAIDAEIKIFGHFTTKTLEKSDVDIATDAGVEEAVTS